MALPWGEHLNKHYNITYGGVASLGQSSNLISHIIKQMCSLPFPNPNTSFSLVIS